MTKYLVIVWDRDETDLRHRAWETGIWAITCRLRRIEGVENLTHAEEESARKGSWAGMGSRKVVGRGHVCKEGRRRSVFR